MTSKATTPEQYLKELPADRKRPVTELRNVVLKNLPKGFKEVVSYGMLGCVVPHEIYPAGYHCDPGCHYLSLILLPQKTLLPFITWVFMLCPNY